MLKKSFTLEVVKRMNKAQYNANTGNIISWWTSTSLELIKGTLILISERLLRQILQGKSQSNWNNLKAQSNITPKNLQVYGDDAVSMFRDGEVDDSQMVSTKSSRWFNPIPSDATPRTLAQSTKKVDPDTLENITKHE